MTTTDADRAKLVARLRSDNPARGDLLRAADLLEAFPDRLREAEEADRRAKWEARVTPSPAGSSREREALEAVNEWFGQREAGVVSTNTEATLFAKVNAALSADAGSSPEPSEAEVEAAEHAWNAAGLPKDRLKHALRAAYALRSTPRPAEAPSDGFTAAPSQAPVGDKDRAELAAKYRQLARTWIDIAENGALPSQSDYEDDCHEVSIQFDEAATAHERDGQIIADRNNKILLLRRQRDDAEDEIAILNTRGHAGQQAAEAALVSIRSQVEAETTERVVAWLGNEADRQGAPNGERAQYLRHLIEAVEALDWRGDHLKATQVPPTGTNESEGK